MWNNDLRSLWNFLLRRKWNEIRLLTFAKQIFHSEAISLAEGEFHWKRKDTLSRVFLFLAPQVGLEPTTHGLTVRCSTDWAIEEYLVLLSVEQPFGFTEIRLPSAKLTVTVFGDGCGSQNRLPQLLVANDFDRCPSVVLAASSTGCARTQTTDFGFEEYLV